METSKLSLIFKFFKCWRVAMFKNNIPSAKLNEQKFYNELSQLQPEELVTIKKEINKTGEACKGIIAAGPRFAKDRWLESKTWVELNDFIQTLEKQQIVV